MAAGESLASQPELRQAHAEHPASSWLEDCREGTAATRPCTGGLSLCSFSSLTCKLTCSIISKEKKTLVEKEREQRGNPAKRRGGRSRTEWVWPLGRANHKRAASPLANCCAQLSCIVNFPSVLPALLILPQQSLRTPFLRAVPCHQVLTPTGS